MIKKISLALLLCSMLFACGKKGDPEFKNHNKKTENLSIITLIV
tara:strand:+ start:441 stop:572 length:132 start_codon:yes stop_codon:yes gene_type:complete